MAAGDLTVHCETCRNANQDSVYVVALPTNVRQDLIDLKIKSKKHPEGGVHNGVRCDGCKSDVKSIRYKCAVCDDFDFCDGCYAKFEKSGAASQVGPHESTRHPFWEIGQNVRMTQ